MTFETVVSEVDGGLILAVYVQPRASKTRLVGLYDGMLKIACSSPPVDGKANKELIRFLAGLFGCPKRSVILLRGGSSRRKQFQISGLSSDKAKRIMQQYLS